MSAFDWFRVNNKYDFRLANRFAQHEFFKFFITKDNYLLKHRVCTCIVAALSSKKSIHHLKFQFVQLHSFPSFKALFIS